MSKIWTTQLLATLGIAFYFKRRNSAPISIGQSILTISMATKTDWEGKGRGGKGREGRERNAILTPFPHFRSGCGMRVTSECAVYDTATGFRSR